jgi:myo-inositol 2-dehydrogenase/D-chiro-inositol 1-dehydrogenase
VATADPDPKARAWASRLTRVPTYQRAEDLLQREDVDAVVICVPTHLHAPLALAAAAAGKHFYLEKPIATSLEDAERVLAAAAQAGVSGVVGFNRRFHPLFQRARAFLTRGRLGRVLAVQTAFSEPTPPSSMPEWKRRRATGGGVLLDLASHHVDLLRWFLDDEVATATAALASDVSEHDSARVEFAMQSGVEVQSFFSFRAGLADFLEFIGERGTLRVDRHRSRLVLRVHRRLGYGVRDGWIFPGPDVVAWRLRRLIRPSVDPSYGIALSRFAEMLGGRPVQLPSLADGMASLRAILAAERSACVAPPNSSN